MINRKEDERLNEGRLGNVGCEPRRSMNLCEYYTQWQYFILQTIKYLGFISRDLGNILAVFHLQGFGICHFYRMGPKTKILIHFTAPTYATSFTHLYTRD
jgi:hypothetical protein